MFKKLIYKKIFLGLLVAASFLGVTSLKGVEKTKAMMGSFKEKQENCNSNNLEQLQTIELADIAKNSVKGVELSIYNSGLETHENNDDVNVELFLEIVNNSGSDKILSISNDDVMFVVEYTRLHLKNFNISPENSLKDEEYKEGRARSLWMQKKVERFKFNLKNKERYSLKLTFERCDFGELLSLCPKGMLAQGYRVYKNYFKGLAFVDYILKEHNAKLCFFRKDSEIADFKIES